MTLADLRQLERRELDKIKKDALVNIILSSKNSTEEPNLGLQDKLDAISRELADNASAPKLS